jgi:hypothetical protein
MGVPTSEVCYTSATTGRGDHKVHKGHVVALAKKDIYIYIYITLLLAVSDKDALHLIFILDFISHVVCLMCTETKDVQVFKIIK